MRRIDFKKWFVESYGSFLVDYRNLVRSIEFTAEKIRDLVTDKRNRKYYGRTVVFYKT